MVKVKNLRKYIYTLLFLFFVWFISGGLSSYLQYSWASFDYSDYEIIFGYSGVLVLGLYIIDKTLTIIAKWLLTIVKGKETSKV